MSADPPPADRDAAESAEKPRVPALAVCPAQGTRHEPGLPLSVVIPALNAASALPATLLAVRDAAAEIILVDGGSTDGTPGIAAGLGARVIAAPRGRGVQLAAGAAAAGQPWMLFLHADTRPGPGWARAVAAFIADPAHAARAAHFRFALDDAAPEARRLERWVAWRCRWLALPYGDQGLLIHRALHDAIGGFRPLPLMEDVDIVRRLGRRRIHAIDIPFVTSADRWRAEGWGRQSRRNLFCLLLWYLGVPPARIARLYERAR